MILKTLTKKTKIVIAFSLVLFIAGITFAVVLATAGISKDKIVVYIDELPVSYGEFVLIMDENRGDVVSDFYDNYHIDEAVDFWDKDTRFGGKCPLEELKNKVIEILKVKKSEQQLMMDYGIVTAEELKYSNFNKLWKKENEKRKKTIAQGGVVYGVEEYTEIGYYNYLHNMRKIELREKLFEESDSTNTEDKFTNALIDKKTAQMVKDAEVKTEKALFDKIKAVAE